ncbi:ABC transporter permease [Kocuria sp. HSID16901]|uniref:ABC transporter permease n=1 Tax=Kocuria sp. HSID16901 TaxID=2419505 RepID=UPI00066141F2|nr:ABC transporter permease [Kocuria sp. HSID16901]MCT1368283.1 ABC transporter permease [Rothia sp. p3-SID1597]RUQ23194.1 ABC transporter permease [Kocuria sp. HSID16901]
MFVGIRDVFYAKGRFALIGSVVGLITLLLVMLTGLTGGLASQNTSALTALGPDRFAFGAPVAGNSSGAAEDPKVDYSASQITEKQVHDWSSTDGVSQATPVGFTQTQLAADGSAGAAVLGVPNGDIVKNAVGAAVDGTTDVGDHDVVVSQSIADDQGASVGKKVSISGQDFTVSGVVPDEYYSHSPVAWMNTAGWQQVAHVQSSGDDAVVGTALAVNGNLDQDGWKNAADESKTVVSKVKDSFSGLPAYSSEHSSLLTMQAFLYGISALVTVSFLTVWTIQRTRDIAILRALGAGGKYLIRDAVGQAAIVLAVGALVGLGLGAGLGWLAQNGVPFQLNAANTLLPAAGIWVLGMLGSLLAVRKVAKIDPLIALGGN